MLRIIYADGQVNHYDDSNVNWTAVECEASKIVSVIRDNVDVTEECKHEIAYCNYRSKPVELTVKFVSDSGATLKKWSIDTLNKVQVTRYEIESIIDNVNAYEVVATGRVCGALVFDLSYYRTDVFAAAQISASIRQAYTLFV